MNNNTASSLVTDAAPWDELENRQATLLDLRFQRDVGLPFSPEAIQEAADAVESQARAMAPDHRNDAEAYGLLCRLIQAAQALPLGIALQEQRDSLLTTSKFTTDESPVTPYNVLNRLRVEEDADIRNAILSHFCKPDDAIDAADDARRVAQREIATALGMTPLDEFLSSEELTLEALRQLLLDLGDGLAPAARSILLERRREHFPEMTGELSWQDSVFTGVRGDAAATVNSDSEVVEFDGLAKIVATARAMGFPAENVYADLADRPKKYPGATAYRIRIPSDVRVRVKPLGDPMRDTAILFHEMGHALHFISVDPTLPLPARIGFNFATSETFSFWLESLWMSREYLTSEIGLSSEKAGAVVDSAHHGFTLSAVIISALALAIVDYWASETPLTRDQIEASLSGYFERFLGFPLPSGAIRWYTGTVLALEINTLGYPVALARLGHLLSLMESRRADWWNSAEAVEPIRAYMRGGRRANFPAQMLDTAPFIERMLTDGFNPRA